MSRCHDVTMLAGPWTLECPWTCVGTTYVMAHRLVNGKLNTLASARSLVLLRALFAHRRASLTHEEERGRGISAASVPFFDEHWTALDHVTICCCPSTRGQDRMSLVQPMCGRARVLRCFPRAGATPPRKYWPSIVASTPRRLYTVQRVATTVPRGSSGSSTPTSTRPFSTTPRSKMTAQKIDGTAIAKSIREKLGATIKERQQQNSRYKPSLKIVQGESNMSATPLTVLQTVSMLNIGANRMQWATAPTPAHMCA